MLGYQCRECEMDFSSSDPRSHHCKQTVAACPIDILFGFSEAVTILYIINSYRIVFPSYSLGQLLSFPQHHQGFGVKAVGDEHWETGPEAAVQVKHRPSVNMQETKYTNHHDGGSLLIYAAQM